MSLCESTHYSLDEYHFELPSALVAQYPVTFRDHCRLLVHQRQTQGNEHRRFYHLPEYLRAGDVLVFNNTEVLPSRCFFYRATGGRVEVFYLQGLSESPLHFEALLRGKAKQGEPLFCEDVEVQLLEKTASGSWILKASAPPLLWLKRLGQIPLPPYIKRAKGGRESVVPDFKDRQDYQTVFHQEPGAVAAPTAGLHFTSRLLETLKAQGVECVFITLHVGLGTFQPIECTDFRQHLMHKERYWISESAQKQLLRAKAEGRRIIAVGTTSVRTLESAGPELEKPHGETQIFIYPPYSFHWIHGLITNFHLPKTTLLLLVAALMGKSQWFESYQEAIRESYRFFSYGDGMFIL
jgi:S-adenosylmethionine:tRNA ribosyltransferase-isomerase